MFFRPDSILCKICDPTVKEKPGGSSARRRSARSARSSRSSARSYVPEDEEAALGDPDLAPDDASNTEDLASLQTETEEVPDADTEAGDVAEDGAETPMEEAPEEPEMNDEGGEEPAEEEIEDDME